MRDRGAEDQMAEVGTVEAYCAGLAVEQEIAGLAARCTLERVVG